MSSAPKKAASAAADYENQIGKHLEEAIQNLFGNPFYIPTDPYKVVINSFRRKERFQEWKGETKAGVFVSTSAPFPTTSENMALVKFSTNGCSGLKHLAKLLSGSSIKRIFSLFSAVKEVLGSLPTAVKQSSISANFIETVSISSCFSSVVAVSRTHIFESVLECIIRGKTLDSCITFFIRRVVDEALQAEKSPIIVSAQIKVRMGGRSSQVHVFPVKSFDTKRQQFLSVMKSAIVDSGDIYIEMYVRVQRVLLPSCLTSDNVLKTEASVGFVKVTRRYNFCFVDPNNQSRCFSKHPFETLARGVFFDIKDAVMYKDVYIGHLKRMKRPSNENGGNSEVLLDNVITHFCEQVVGAFDAGDIVTAGEWLLQLYALLVSETCHPKFPSSEYGGLSGAVDVLFKSLALLTSHSAGYIHAAIDAFVNLSAIVPLLMDDINTHSHLLQHYYSAAGKSEAEIYLNGLSEMDKAAILSATTIYESLYYAILEARMLLLNVIRDVVSSEMEYAVGQFLLKQLSLLFDPDVANIPMLNQQALQNSKTGLIGLLPLLGQIMSPINSIVNCLSMLKSSLATDSLLNIFERDLNRMNAWSRLRAAAIAAHEDRGGLFGTPKTGRNRLYEIYPLSDVPCGILELFGFVFSKVSSPRGISLVNYHNELPMNINELHYNEYVPCVLSPLTRSLFENSTVLKSDYPFYLGMISLHAEDASLLEGSFWTAVSQLSFHWFARHGAVDIITSGFDELNRYEIPKAAAGDGALMRTLVESQLYTTLHRCVFELSLLPENRSSFVFSTLGNLLYPQSSLLRMLKHSDKHRLAFLYSAELSYDFSIPPDCSRASRLLLSSCYIDNTGLGGGLYAPANVLCGLGCRLDNSFDPTYVGGGGIDSSDNNNNLPTACDVIYQRMWMIPPYVRSLPPSPSGLRMNMYAGLNLITAARWAWFYLNHPFPKNDATNNLRVNKSVTNRIDDLIVSEPNVYTPNHNPLSHQEYSAFQQSELGVLNNPGEIQIELAYKCIYDRPENAYKMHALFASEVRRTLQYLVKQTYWHIFHVVIKIPGRRNTFSEKVFDAMSICGDDASGATAMKLIGKYGNCELHCSCGVIDNELDINVLAPNSLASEGTAGGASGDAAVEADEWIEALRMKSLDEKFSRGVPMSSVISKLCAIRKYRELNAVEPEDPTFNDSERVTHTGECAQHIQSMSYDAAKNTGTSTTATQKGLPSEQKGPRVRCFAPCIMRFALLGICTQAIQLKQQKKKKSNKIKPPHVGMLSFGSPETLARLTAGTVWLSPNSSNGVWECVRHVSRQQEYIPVSNDTALKCFNTEAQKHFKMVRVGCATRDLNLVCAYEHAAAYCLITNERAAAAALSHMISSLAGRLKGTLDCVHMLMELMKRPDVSTFININTLGHTIVRHVCLATRLVVTSPRCIHLHGGSMLLLKKLEQLEAVLHLGRLEMHMAGGLDPLPNTLPPYYSSESDGSENTRKDAIDGELELRKRMGMSNVPLECVNILQEIFDMGTLLCSCLAEDVHQNVLDVMKSTFLDEDTYPVVISQTVDVTSLRTHSSASSSVYSMDSMGLEFNDGNSDIIPGSPLSQSSMQQQDYLEGIGEDPRESDEMDEDGGLPLADVDQGINSTLSLELSDDEDGDDSVVDEQYDGQATFDMSTLVKTKKIASDYRHRHAHDESPLDLNADEGSPVCDDEQSTFTVSSLAKTKKIASNYRHKQAHRIANGSKLPTSFKRDYEYERKLLDANLLNDPSMLDQFGDAKVEPHSATDGETVELNDGDGIEVIPKAVPRHKPLDIYNVWEDNEEHSFSTAPLIQPIIGNAESSDRGPGDGSFSAGGFHVSPEIWQRYNHNEDSSLSSKGGAGMSDNGNGGPPLSIEVGSEIGSLAGEGSDTEVLDNDEDDSSTASAIMPSGNGRVFPSMLRLLRLQSGTPVPVDNDRIESLHNVNSMLANLRERNMKQRNVANIASEM